MKGVIAVLAASTLVVGFTMATTGCSRSSVVQPTDSQGKEPTASDVVTVQRPVLSDLSIVGSLTPLSDGSLLYVERKDDSDPGRLWYLDARASEPQQIAVSTTVPGIVEATADEEWFAWVEVNQATGDWSLMAQKKQGGHAQRIAGFGDERVGAKGNDPLLPQLNDGKLVYMEPAPDGATNIVGYDLKTGEHAVFTNSGLAVLPSLSQNHLLYGEVYSDGRRGGTYWLTSWSGGTPRKVVDYPANTPALAYPWLAVPEYGEKRSVRLVNLDTDASTKISEETTSDLVVAASSDYIVWHQTTERFLRAYNVGTGKHYTISAPADYLIVRPKVSGRFLAFEGFDRKGAFHLFRVLLP